MGVESIESVDQVVSQMPLSEMSNKPNTSENEEHRQLQKIICTLEQVNNKFEQIDKRFEQIEK